MFKSTKESLAKSLIHEQAHPYEENSVYIELKSVTSESKGNKDKPQHASPEKSVFLQYKSQTKTLNQEDSSENEPKDYTMRYFIFVCCVFFLIIGRYNVPENEPPCIVDKVMDWLEGVNTYILENPIVRDSLQILCSLFMDVMFLSTFLHWIYHGKSGRLIFVSGMFYIIRAAVQAIWYSPFPPGYWWNSPGIPSLVVPYGRGSDFFFSGHAGFSVICGLEWRKNGNPFMVRFITLGGLYTMFILIAYRIHYSIDVFTGVIVAHWCFMIVDAHKEKIDLVFSGAFGNVKDVLRYRKKTQCFTIEKNCLKEMEQEYYAPDRELEEMDRKNSKLSRV